MRRLPLCKLLALLCCCSTIVFIYFLSDTHFNASFSGGKEQILKGREISEKASSSKSHKKRIVLSFVVCDSRFNESLNVIKSVLLFTSTPVHFVIFSDDQLRMQFNKTLSNWKSLLKDQLDFELQRINFPEAHEEEWLNLFSKCAAQRLFIPKLISHLDAMIYVDTDTLFLGPVDELWYYFSQFNESQISAMTLEDDNPSVSWYPRFAKHPFYGKYGLNSGVMLMNLTRMRSFGWVDYVTPIMLKWKLYIPWGDQVTNLFGRSTRIIMIELHLDIINIIFHYHERAVYVLSCRYNYRSDQCMYGDACADATSRGVFVLHGSRKIFHNEKQPAFQAIYNAIDEYELGTDPMVVLSKIEKYFTEAPQSNCANLKYAFLKVPTETLSRTYTKPDR